MALSQYNIWQSELRLFPVAKVDITVNEGSEKFVECCLCCVWMEISVSAPGLSMLPLFVLPA